LRAFLALSRHLNFSKAAAELRVTQPALSAQIKALEGNLGSPLFQRTTRRVQLTAEGARFVLRARRLVEEINRAVGELKDGSALERGTIAFSCIPTIAAVAFPRIIREFSLDHPGVRVQMTDDTTTAMERRILNGEVEFGVGGAPRWREALAFSSVLDDPFVLVCRRDHPLARRAKVSIRDVLKHPQISLAIGSNVRTVLTRLLEADGLAFTPAHELVHHHSVGAMIEAGLGVSLLPSIACDMLRKTSVLRIVPLAEKRYSRAIGLITRRGVVLSAPAQRFYDLVLRTMATRFRRNSQRAMHL
jgi:DNA-binding transcriptional LysR family regulator